VYKNISFFGALTAQGNRSFDASKGWRDVPIFVESGVDTTVTYTPAGTTDTREVIIPKFVQYDQRGRLPFSENDQYTLDSKLDYTYGSGSRIFLTGKMSRGQGRTPFGAGLGNLYNASSYSGASARSDAAILGWTHNFVQSSDRALALDLKLAATRDVNLGG